ncbi:MAG: hypothetical protein H7308_10010 [Chthonomonadaceae bacterium]|nr:hypothetical protein [Chthonomonadaceae bacterium]
MAITTYEQFMETGVVSVFVGDFKDGDALDDYLNDQFLEDFGFEIDPVDPDEGPEADVELDRLEIRSLVAQYTDGDQFCEAAGEAADALHIEERNTAIIFYHFRYKPEMALARDESPVRFLGVFPFVETIPEEDEEDEIKR